MGSHSNYLSKQYPNHQDRYNPPSQPSWGQANGSYPSTSYGRGYPSAKQSTGYPSTSSSTEYPSTNLNTAYSSMRVNTGYPTSQGGVYQSNGYPSSGHSNYTSVSVPMRHTVSNSSGGSSQTSSTQSYGNYNSSNATSPGSANPPSPHNTDIRYAGSTSTSTTTKAAKESRKSNNADGSSSSTYPCLYPECTYAPKRQYDLDRHMKTHFPPSADEMYDCPGRGCGRQGAHGFKRKDHMNEHVSNFHMLDPKTKKSKKVGEKKGGR